MLIKSIGAVIRGGKGGTRTLVSSHGAPAGKFSLNSRILKNLKISPDLIHNGANRRLCVMAPLGQQNCILFGIFDNDKFPISTK